MAVAGHSLGEYSAAYAAGGVSFRDAVALVQKRGRYMSEAVPPGTGLVAALLGLFCGRGQGGLSGGRFGRCGGGREF